MIRQHRLRERKTTNGCQLLYTVDIILLYCIVFYKNRNDRRQRQKNRRRIITAPTNRTYINLYDAFRRSSILYSKVPTCDD